LFTDAPPAPPGQKPFAGQAFPPKQRLSRLTSRWTPAKGGTVYNLAGQRTNVVRTLGDSASYSYDGMGQLKTAKGKEAGGVTNRLHEQFGYAYDGAGMLASVSNSFIGASSVVSYNYDALGRMTNRAINGAVQQLAFDVLHRVTMVTNVLGWFANIYCSAAIHFYCRCRNRQSSSFALPD